MKIGIYGGTFNPLHYGHLRTAEEVYELLSLDMVVFVPSGKPPFDKPELESTRHRYKMVKIAIKDNPHFKISDMEIKARGKSYSVDTVKRLKSQYKGSELFFLLGIDAFLDLPDWKQPEKLINLTNMVIISRPGYTFTELLSSPYLKDVSRRILKELDKGARTKFSFDLSKKQKGFLCKVTGLNISASNIRNMITSGESTKYLLPDSVKSYIIFHKLYKRKA